MQIVNVQAINLDKLQIPTHSCMPDLSGNQNETWAVIDHNRLISICSLWLKNAPAFKDYNTSVLGNFFTQDRQAGKELLLHAVARAKMLGSEYVIGPMNGSTWSKYRLVTEAGTSPPFLMEYYTPAEWPEIFVSAGFEEIATYYSASTEQIVYEDRSATKFIAKQRELGVTIRPFNKAQATSDLTAIHALSLQSFSKNFLYTDISLADFLAVYEKILPYVVPEFFLLAEHRGKLVGFIFAIPDFLKKQMGKEVDSLIIKTVAKIPDRTYAGLGNYLVYTIHQRAAEKGFKEIIHALMYDSNVSRSISNKSAQTIRKYTLYGKQS